MHILRDIKMKYKIVAVLLTLLFAVSAMARTPMNRNGATPMSATIDLQSYIDANRILMFVTNRGSFAYDQGGLLGKNDGLYYPFTSVQDILDSKNTTSVVFASGIWIGGINAANGDTLVTVAEYSDDYYPGAMSNFVADTNVVGDTITGGLWSYDPSGETSPNYRVYKLYSDSMADNPNQDYLDWPVANGAPVDSLGNPKITGDVMCWAVYNDNNPAPHTNDASSNDGLGVEIHQSTFAFAREGALANIVFVKFQIYNKGGLNINDMYVSLWADPDLGGAGDDFVGCDTNLSLGYCYNDGADADYGNNPPAVGYDFFQGPLFYTGDTNDVARMWDTTYQGYINLPMSSFNKYINGTDPQSPFHSYNYMQGLERDGAPLVFGTDTTKYYGWGDPVAGTGFLDANSSDRRYMLSTGPFDFAPGDSTEIVAAIIVGRSTSELKSITELKNLDLFAQKVYDSNFVLPSPPAKPDVSAKSFPNEILLTWGTASEDDPGDYTFEGYAVFQGPTSVGPWNDTLAWFDVKNDVAGIIDYRFNTAAQAELPYVAKPGTNDGLQHHLFLDRDVVGGGGLINYTEYYYRIEAYSYDSTAPNGEKTLTSASTIVVSPRGPLAGTDFNSNFGDSLTVSHSAGNSPGRVEAYVVDPSAVTGDDYMVTFSTDPTLGNVWHVINTTTGDTVVANWVNQSGVEGVENYPIADGVQVKAFGSPPSIELFEVVANGTGALASGVAGALDFQGFPTPGGTNPGADQQVGEGHWALHTGDNGGSCDGGTRGSFDAFLARVTRSGGNLGAMGGYDYEMRFTGDTNAAGVYDQTLGGGSWGIEAFEAAGQERPIWVPFELWRIGIGTPDDTTDDVKMIPWVLEIAGGNDVYDMENWGCPTGTFGGTGEHSASGADNDPFTDWVYWYLPEDVTPGDAGYLAKETQIRAWTPGNTVYDFGDTEIFARTVLINWNGDTTSVGNFNQRLPEPGTVFRITTAKPNGPADQFTYSTAGYQPTVDTTGTAADLANIRPVPNPYYLFSDYDASNEERTLKFTNLPRECTISIYTIMGDKIAEVYKNDATSEAAWDIENSSGIPIASGVYIYVVDAPGFGQKVGKVAVFTEIELLDQY